MLNHKFTRVLIIGDSWCRGYYNTTEHPNEGVGRCIVSYLNSDAYIKDVSVSGSGFTLGGKTFPQQATEATNAETNQFDLALIIGGVNDTSESNVSTAVANTLNTIKTHSPNCKIHIFPMNLAYGGKFEVSDKIGSPLRARVLSAIQQGCIDCDNSNVYIHNGVYRWGYYLGSNLSDTDTIHLNKAGYKAWARLAANLIKSGTADFYPTFAGVASNYSGHGEVSRDSVVESNGVITINIAINFTEDNPTGTYMYLPEWAQPGFSRFITGVVNGQSNVFLSFDTDGRIAIQGTTATRDNWLFINYTYIAGC